MTPLRLLLVEDNPDFLAAASAYLCNRPQVRVLRVAASGEEALDLCSETVFDLALIDLQMPGMNGLETTRRLKALAASPKIIVITLLESPEYRHVALKAGADGFIAKSEFATALLPLIDTLFPDSAPA